VRPTPPTAGAERGPPLEILLVEDDADIRDSFTAILELDGYRVRSAADGPAALAVLAEGLPDVALVDIGLPEMDGYELARQIRRRWPSEVIPLIALTGYGEAADRQAALAAGFDAHLAKPLRPKELYRLLATIRPGEPKK
jgi:CheY-like chemotaxis protein